MDDENYEMGGNRRSLEYDTLIFQEEIAGRRDEVMGGERDEDVVNICWTLLGLSLSSSFELGILLSHVVSRSHSAFSWHIYYTMTLPSLSGFIAGVTSLCALKLYDGGWLARRLAHRPRIRRRFLVSAVVLVSCFLCILFGSLLLLGGIRVFLIMASLVAVWATFYLIAWLHDSCQARVVE